MNRSSTVVIRIELPFHDGLDEEQHVHDALVQMACSYLEADRELMVAGCYGNWDYRVEHSPAPYQPTLWQDVTAVLPGTGR